MLMKKQEAMENIDPVSEKLSTLILALSLVAMCFAEFAVTHRLWFGPKQTTDGFDSRLFVELDRFFVPFMVFCPALLSVLMRFSMTNMARAGQIGAKTAATLKLNLGTMTMITYIAISELAKLRPR